MKRLAASKHFHRQLKKLSAGDQRKVLKKLKEFLSVLAGDKIPMGYGFKKINGDKYEIRVDLKIRIALKNEGNTFVCHVVGDHNQIKRYLREYRSK